MKLSDDFLPELLRDGLQDRWQQFMDACPPAEQPLLRQLLKDQPELARGLARAGAVSHYFLHAAKADPADFIDLLRSGELQREYLLPEWVAKVLEVSKGAADLQHLAERLRHFRRRQMCRIIWRTLAGGVGPRATALDLSHLAQACLDIGAACLHKALLNGPGLALGAEPPPPLVILGMGKLGGYELNLSSDVDLILAYPDQDQLAERHRAGQRTFFLRLAQQLIDLMERRTASGFVWRMDARLRPYGDSGPLVQSFAAIEAYYHNQGRPWERYALVKARQVAGAPEAGERLWKILQPFVYRSYTDYGAIAELRLMKQLIEREQQLRGLEEDLKRGAGGIREIEFIVQTQQLIRGGRDPSLQSPELLPVLELLGERGYLPVAVAARLREAYLFLRHAENVIQAREDRQQHSLPLDPEGRAGLALAAGFADWEAFHAACDKHRQAVREHFGELIADPVKQGSPSASAAAHGQLLWQSGKEPTSMAPALREAGFGESSIAALRKFRDSARVRQLQATAAERLDRFMPLLLDMLSGLVRPDVGLHRLLPLVETVLGRTAYLALLAENPLALRRWVELCVQVPWIARQLASYPVLLDELLDARGLYSVPSAQDLAAQLRQQLRQLPWERLEEHMEGLRYFRMSNMLRVAVCETYEILPLMKVSDCLSWIAEIVLDHALQLAWQGLVKRHGTPMRSPEEPCELDFVILAYGKLGGLELGYASDLDIVFIYDAPGDEFSRGKQPLSNAQFFTRMAQRILHVLGTRTSLGTLYDVDLRLRPDGGSGPVVSSFQAFARYQDSQAWPWEHQALVRSRVVAGCPRLADRFATLRREVLCRRRNSDELAAQVRTMRQRMQQEIKPGESDDLRRRFAIKHGPGGMVDIEFMVQYAVLAWAHAHPELADWPDNIRILETLEEKQLFTAQEARAMTEAYKLFRGIGHQLALGQDLDWPADELQRLSGQMQAKWKQLLGGV